MSSNSNRSIGRAFALRLGLWYAGLFIVSAVALSAATYVLLARALAAQDHDVLQSMLSRYAIEYQRSGLAGLQRVIAADAGQGRHEGLLVRVVDARTEAVYFAAPPGWGAFDLSALDAPSFRASGWATLGGLPDGAVLEVGSVVLPNRVMVQVGRSSHVRDELLGRFRSRGLEILALIVVAAVAGGFLLTRAALAPLRALEGTVRSILQTGQFDARVPIRNSHDPLDELGARVNEMLERIQSLVGGMRGAIDNVAHDLRTPLTRFRNVAEAALLTSDPERAREGLAQALEEADRVNATLTALMDISQAETGTMALVRQPVRLGQVVDEAIALYADEADDCSIALASTVPDDLRVDADHTRLRQVLANLIENAVKYTDPDGRIDISAGAGDGFVTLHVRDTGIGIAAEHLPHVWDRLYRADPSRTTRGLGLGLSLIKAVVEAHGGRVAVTSAPGQGSTFTVMLPIAAQNALGGTVTGTW
jgi:signal transduction histidine kinase